ncbi:DUF1249 domain-containing protein [Halothiobacillus sp. DCM-1]|uniref:DUF1249 domain-containing protein n=1 Tax=Halothiobacillus sp. DCM-1 TaxID=3112558 RepID=UPI00325026FC
MNQQFLHSTQPIHFLALMELYEHNYILVRRLFGDLKRLKTGDECPWHADVIARVRSAERHTLEIHFTDHRQLDAKQRPIRLKIRICHDARTAELISKARRNQCLESKITLCIKKQFEQNQLLKIWLTDQLDRLRLQN